MPEATGGPTIIPFGPRGAFAHGGVPPAYDGKRNGSAKRLLNVKDPMSWARALVAEEFVADPHRTLHKWGGQFYRWNGSRYESLDIDAVKAIAWRYLESSYTRGDPGTPPNRFKPNRSAVSDLIEALGAVCSLPSNMVVPAWLDDVPRPKAAEMLALENGLLHLPSGEMLDPTPAFFTLNATDVAYDPDAPPPDAWLTFLDTVFTREDENGAKSIDQEAQEALQDWFGYALLPDTSQQKIMLLVGPKRAGKGTIMWALKRVVGPGNVVAPTLDGLAGTFGLEPLIGKTLAIVGDARLSGRADQAPIVERLLSISGEDTCTVGRKFLHAWTGQLPTRFFISTNIVPSLSDASGALASRFIVIVLEQSFFGREDLSLKDRIAAELPGILNWAIAGYRRLKERRHFIQPKSGAEAIEDLEMLGSPVSAFVKECCEVAHGFETSVDAVFEKWKTWCQQDNRREPGTKQRFGRDLKASVAGLKVVQHRDGGDRERFYSGLKLKPFWEIG